MDRTIREVAEMLEVSKSAVRKYMDAGFREHFTHQDGNKILISEEGVADLKSRIKGQGAQSDSQGSTHSSAQFQSSSNEAYKALEEQLKVKDDQIANLHKLLDQAQQLQLVAENKVKQLELAEPEEKQSVSQEPVEEPTVERKSWFSRLFK